MLLHVSDNAVFETDWEEIQVEMQKHKYSKQMPRTRQISTSLVKDPVKDDNLKDFHEHHLSLECDPLDVQYKMYAMICHSGVLGKLKTLKEKKRMLLSRQFW